MTNNMEKTLSCIEIEPQQPAKQSIIWLHGLGADASDFVPFAHELKLAEPLAVRFVFPNAPMMPVTINNGMTMRAWFDIYSLHIDQRIDENTIQQSIQSVQQLIEREEKRGIPSQNILLGGFSQGALIALMTGLTFPKTLAGVIALSGFLPNTRIALGANNEANRRLPIFMGHGTEDIVVPYSLGRATEEDLKQAGYPVKWHAYPMAHSVCYEEVMDIRDWILKRFESN